MNRCNSLPFIQVACVLMLVFVLVLTQASHAWAQAADNAAIRDVSEGNGWYNPSQSCQLNTADADTSGSTSGPIDLAAIAAEYKLQSAIVTKVNGKIVAEYRSSEPPTSPASTMKLVVADTFLQQTGIDINKEVKATNDVLYNAAGGDTVVQKGQTVTLKAALSGMLKKSSNVGTNLLMKELGGVEEFTKKAQAAGYVNTKVVSFYSESGGGNKSTIADQAAAMSHIQTSSGEGYNVAKIALGIAAGTEQGNPYKLDDYKNKWGGTSTIASNVGAFKTSKGKFIIGSYHEGDDFRSEAAYHSMHDGTDAIVKALENTASGGSDSAESKTVNGSVYMVGDSITEMTKNNLSQAFDTAGLDVTKINGAVSRSMTSKGEGQHNGPDAVGADESGGSSISGATSIVVALGTNNSGNRSAFRIQASALVDKIRGINSTANIYWVNIFSKVSHQDTYNSVLQDLSSDGEIKIIDMTAVDIKTSSSDDNVHPLVESYDLYAKTVAGSISGGASTTDINTTAGCACTVNGGTNVVENLSAFDPDPAAEKVFKDSHTPKIKEFMPLYQKAAELEGMPQNWEILAGLHATETNYGRKWIGNGVQSVTGPFQEQTTELSQHLDDPKYADLKTLIHPGGALKDAGTDVDDKEFIVLGRLALARWVKQGLGDAEYEKLKTAPIPFTENVSEDHVFWKIMKRWNGVAAGYQGFTGYNKTNYKMPQPIVGYGAGGMWNQPGSATIYFLIKKNGISGGSSGSADCTTTVDGGGTYQEIGGSREEIAQRLLESSNLKLGNFGNAGTQRTDIQTGATDELVRLMLAANEQSGAPLLVNAIKTDHKSGTAHGAGRAVDIGYYGNGYPNHNDDGDKMYKFLYANRKELKIKQLIWKYPPGNLKCVNRGEPVECSSYGSILNDHNHHIHAGL